MRPILILTLVAAAIGTLAWGVSKFNGVNARATARPVKCKATIVGLNCFNTSRTFLEDEHGHRDSVFGIWGKQDEVIMIECRDGILYVK